ncbi:MAG: Fic family protein [Nocardia sp.]|nr:Fic family protein [Nocardia sp.]
MIAQDGRYIWQQAAWPGFEYDSGRLAGRLAEVTYRQGHMVGRLSAATGQVRELASIDALTEDVVETSAIEGERLDVASVRSSVARHLGVDIGALQPADRHIDGVVEMILDATARSDRPVTDERLFGWHAGLFPTGYSGISKIRIGNWRTDSGGPMRVVSGAYGHERVHFEAPPAQRLDSEMHAFLDWMNRAPDDSPIIKAGVAHLWFVTVHPFDDGNGRIARALGDLWLARSDSSERRFYSLSAQIQRDRSEYYRILERSQKGTLDITEWLLWFLGALDRALTHAETTADAVLAKTLFWQQHRLTAMNPRQVAMVNRLLDGFTGKLTTRKWAIITKTSPDTALRDINELIENGVLRKSAAAGRSTSYELTGPRPVDRSEFEYDPASDAARFE